MCGLIFLFIIFSFFFFKLRPSDLFAWKGGLEGVLDTLSK